MRKYVLSAICVIMMIFPSGCTDRQLLEEASIITSLGLDLDDQNQLLMYTTIPVFSTEVKKKYNISAVKASTIQQGRDILNAMNTGNLVGGKQQQVLISKRLLRKQNIFPYLDVFFRDPKNEINTLVILVDGEVKDIIYANMEDKGRPAAVVRDIVESTHEQGKAVLVRLQQYHRLLLDKRGTPYMPEMKTGKNEVFVSGTALLDRNGKYAASLNLQETTLLLLLQKKVQNPITLTLQMPGDKLDAKEALRYVSINIEDVAYDIKTRYRNDRFAFDIKMDMDITVTERMFRFDQENKSKEFEQMVAKQIKKECQAMVKKIQKQKVDPMCFGMYAQAFQYREWKKVEDDWGKAFAKAEVNIMPVVHIRSFGVSM